MSAAAVIEEPMSKKKTTPVRLSEDAIEWARIASGYTGESVAAYASRALEERAREDVARLHAERIGGPKLPGGKGDPKPRGKG